MSSVEDVRRAAKEVLQRFHREELDPNFGDGLPEQQVARIREGSEEFWTTLEKISEKDVESLTDEEGLEALGIIREVARLDEDLDDPRHKDRVIPEWHNIESEFEALGAS